MVATREFRITLPMSVEEFRIAQLYMVVKFSAKESSGDDGDGVEMLKNEPYEENGRKGQFTHKIYHLAHKLPSWVVAICPKKALFLEEKAWNAYPYCITVLTSPYFTKLKLQVETMHLPDRGEAENALKCDDSTLKRRVVEKIDIATDPVDKYVLEEDPTKFRSTKTGRGPLKPGWSDSCNPVMTAYKLVTVDVPYWGFGPKLEKYVSKTVQRRLFTEANRKAFCWMDEWYGLAMEDIRRMEKDTFENLNKARAELKAKGALPDEDDILSARPVDEASLAAMQNSGRLEDAGDDDTSHGEQEGGSKSVSCLGNLEQAIAVARVRGRVEERVDSHSHV